MFFVSSVLPEKCGWKVSVYVSADLLLFKLSEFIPSDHGGFYSNSQCGCHGSGLFFQLWPHSYSCIPPRNKNRQRSISACRLMFVSRPGSHDSFSFYIDEASPVGPEQPETVQNFVSVFGTVAKKLMRKWLATQTMNFNSQLEAGIRFFDLRISTKPRDPDNELFFAHGLFSATVRMEFCSFFFFYLMWWIFCNACGC